MKPVTLDGLTLSGVVKELNESLRNGKIQKVSMPTKEEIVLQIHTASEGTKRLVISADAGDCGLYLSTHPKKNPKVAPAFCMFLRKNLVGATISSITQTGLDRVVEISLATKDELRRPRELRLVAEIMGKYSNIILMDAEDRILDSIRRVPIDVSRIRQILPGMRYEAPPQRKWNPAVSSVVSLSEVIRPLNTTRMDRFMPRVLDGISTQTAQEVLARNGLPESAVSSDLSSSDYEKLAGTLKALVTEAQANPQPSLQTNVDGTPVFFSLVPYSATYPAESRQFFKTANAMMDYYYSRRQELQRLEQAKAALSRIITKRLQKVEHLIQICEQSLAECSSVAQLQMYADQITANLYRLKKGMKDFESIDFVTGNTLRIQLDVSETPSQTAQRLYKRIAKYKRAEKLNSAQLEEARTEQEFLSGALMYAENAQTLSELGEVRHSLADAGVVTQVRKGSAAAPEEVSRPLRYLSPSGMTVLVGRNDRQNEQLTHRTARRDDIWFHTQKTPGSHVILVTEGRDLNDIDDATIEFAAEVAAAHSRAKRSGKTPVDYTQRRNVKKPPKSPPGKVTYDNYFTVYVDASAGQDRMAEPEGPPLGTM